MADSDGAAKPSTWIPTGKDGVVLLLLVGGGIGGYKLVDTRVDTQVTSQVENRTATETRQLSDFAAKLDALAKRLDQSDANFDALQADRMRDLRAAYEKMGSFTATFEAMMRQIADVRASVDASERRASEGRRDLQREISDLRGEVNNALRQPLVGPRGR
jgi:chromosome segregation ATPase